MLGKINKIYCKNKLKLGPICAILLKITSITVYSKVLNVYVIIHF